MLTEHLLPSGNTATTMATSWDAEGTEIVAEGLAWQDRKAGSLATSLPRTPSSIAVLQQLGRVLKSSTFIHSDKLSRFLRFVVEHVLNGNPRCLKEYLIGVEVYDRNASYDPSQDSIVRTEARRLRSKLKEYYGAEGNSDPVYIYLRPGSYVPVFQFRQELMGGWSPVRVEALVCKDASSIVTAILPFRDISQNEISSAFARGIADELSYALMLVDGCTVISPFLIERISAPGLDLAAMMNKIRAQISFEGSVRAEGSRLRVSARIMNAAGVQLWVKRIDVEVGTETSFAIEEQIAAALSAGFDVARASCLDL